MNIREAETRDATSTNGVVAILHAAIFHAQNVLVNRWAVLSYLLTRMTHGVKVYIAEGDGLVLGTASLVIPAPNTHLGPRRLAYIEDVAVTPSHRRRGIGRHLVEHCIEQAQVLGVQEVALFVDETKMTSLRGWYSNELGFSDSGLVMLSKRLDRK